MRTTHYSDTAPMKELFDRTIRHSPTRKFATAHRTDSGGSRSAITFRSMEYLVRCLVRRMAHEAGVELHVGMLPAEARVRRAFKVPRCKPHLKEWCDHVNDARAVFKEYTEGGAVSRGGLLSACQSLALLETMLRTEHFRFDPVRISPAINEEVLGIWEGLDQDLLRPRSLAILHPGLARIGTVAATTANFLIDGTLIDITTAVEPDFRRSTLRLLAAKAAQAQLGGIANAGYAPGEAPVDRVAILFTRQNRLFEFGIEELFGADGWERYLDGFAELAAITRERDMEPDGMSMTA